MSNVTLLTGGLCVMSEDMLQINYEKKVNYILQMKTEICFSFQIKKTVFQSIIFNIKCCFHKFHWNLRDPELCCWGTNAFASYQSELLCGVFSFLLLKSWTIVLLIFFYRKIIRNRNENTVFVRSKECDFIFEI